MDFPPETFFPAKAGHSHSHSHGHSGSENKQDKGHRGTFSALDISSREFKWNAMENDILMLIMVMVVIMVKQENYRLRIYQQEKRWLSFRERQIFHSDIDNRGDTGNFPKDENIACLLSLKSNRGGVSPSLRMISMYFFILATPVWKLEVENSDKWIGRSAF